MGWNHGKGGAWCSGDQHRKGPKGNRGKGKGKGRGKGIWYEKVATLRHIAEDRSERVDQSSDEEGEGMRGIWKAQLDYQDPQSYHIDAYEPYDPFTAPLFEDIVKFFKTLYPDAARSEIFDICVGVHQMSAGHRLTLGTGSNGAVTSWPREGCIGADLTSVDKQNRRAIFLGCFPTTALKILTEGARGRMTEDDVKRQE